MALQTAVKPRRIGAQRRAYGLPADIHHRMVQAFDFCSIAANATEIEVISCASQKLTHFQTLG